MARSTTRRRLALAAGALAAAAAAPGGRAHAFLKEFEADGPARAVEAVVAAKEAELRKRLRGVLDELERASMRLYLDQHNDEENLEALDL